MKHCPLASIVCVLVLVLALGAAHPTAFAAVQSEPAEPEAQPSPEEEAREEPVEPLEEEEAPPEEEPRPAEQQVPPEPPPQPAPPVPLPQPVQETTPPQLTPTPPQPTSTPPPPAPTPPQAAAEPSAVSPPPVTPEPPAGAGLGQASAAPRNIAKIQDTLRAGPVGQDPTAVRLMDLVDRGARAKDYDTFAVYLAKRNLLRAAEAYAEVAVKLEKTNRDLWLNLGTIQLQLNKLSSALTAYRKAEKLDPSFGLTWYSIGVVHDYMRNYDEAVEAYTVALALDPSLGQFKTNPQAVNNERLLVVNLLLYQAKAGGLAMPLRGGPEPAKPAPAAPQEATKPR